MASPKLPYVTYRVEGLKSDITKEQLTQDFHDADLGHVRHISLARALEESEASTIATVTVESTEPRVGPVGGRWTDGMMLDTKMEGFTPLSRVTTVSSSVDMIAITGLGGRAFASWQYKDGSMWLRDVLPRDIPSANVYIYGYVSDLQDRASTAGLEDYTNEFACLLDRYFGHSIERRPLILVGHSLGCLIIKKMLVDGQERFADLLSRVYTIAFFGAPHRGLENEALRKLLDGKWTERLVEDLSSDSALLRHMNENFSFVSGKIKIISCVELQPTPTAEAQDGNPMRYSRTGPLKMMADPQKSACLYTSNEEIIPIDKNHSQIAKLAIHDAAYKHFSTRLKKDCTEAIPYVRAKLGREKAAQSIELINRIAKSIAMASRHYFKNTTSSQADIFLDIATTFEIFQNFMNGTICEVILIESARKEYGDQLMDTILNILSSLVERYKSYESFVSHCKMKAISYLGQQDLWQPSQEYKTLFEPRTLSSLGEFSVTTWKKLRGLISLAVMGSDIKELAELDPGKQTNLSQSIMQQIRLRIQESSNLQGTLLLGTLQESHDIKSRQIGQMEILNFVPDVGTDVSGPVIVEYRPYNTVPQNTAAENKTARRLEQEKARAKGQIARLAFVLENLWIPGDETLGAPSNGLQTTWNCSLKCLGYLDDKYRERLVLIYEPPKGQKDSPVTTDEINTLHDTIEASNAGKLAPRFSLQQRFKLARAVCDSVLRLHCWGWIHKDIQSGNFLLVETRHVSTLDEEYAELASGNNNPLLIDIEHRYSAYLTGFEVARHVNDYSSGTETEELVANLYRHPDRQNLPTQNFQKIHDIYAVGVVLLEIGLSQTMSSVFGRVIEKFQKTGVSPTPTQIEGQILHVARTSLPSKMGSQYAQAVVRCLTGKFGTSRNEQDIDLSVQFQKLVLEVMEYGCHL